MLTPNPALVSFGSPLSMKNMSNRRIAVLVRDCVNLVPMWNQALQIVMVTLSKKGERIDFLEC